MHLLPPLYYTEQWKHGLILGIDIIIYAHLYNKLKNVMHFKLLIIHNIFLKVFLVVELVVKALIIWLKFHEFWLSIILFGHSKQLIDMEKLSNFQTPVILVFINGMMAKLVFV